MKDRKERLQCKTALAKKRTFSERNTHSLKRNFTSKLFRKTLSKTARGCNSTVNRRYKAPVRHRPSSPTYCRNHFSFRDNHSKVLADDLNEYLLDSEDDFHVNDENLELGCKKEKTVEINGVHTNGNNLKLCSSFCNLNTRLKHFPLVNSCLDKCAIVILTDIHKDMKTDHLKMNTNDSQDAQSKVTKMKPSNSKCPSRPSIVKPVTLSNDLQTVRTTYVKPCDKDTLSDCSKSSTTAKASSVKDVSKGKSVTESTSSLKTESPMTRGDSLDENVSSSKKGKEKTRPLAKKVFADKVETHFPKKRGGKSKKTEESPSLNNEDIESSVDGSVEVTPSKDDKKPVKTPRGRKKNAANATPPVDEELRDKKGGKKSECKSRNVSESPSPRRKQSPKKSPEKASPKSMKRKKVNAQNVENDAKNSLGDNDNAESISGDSNKVKATVRKASKSPVKKREKTDSPTKINSVKESKDIVNEKKSPKRKQKDSATNSAEKKQIKDSPGDSPELTKSPRKNKSVSPKKVKNTDSKAATAMSRKLEFNDEMSKVIYQRSRLSFPPDFEYKYTSSIQTTGPAGLGDLISKVNNAMKENNKELDELFGETEEPVSDSDDKTVSPESSVLSTSADSDKTILDFDLQNNPVTQEETNGNMIKDSEKTESNNIDENKSDSLCENSVENKKDEESLVSELQIKSEVDEDAVKEDITGKPSAPIEDLDESCIQNEDPINSKKENVGNEPEIVGDILNEGQSNHSETVSVFELYGLTLRRKNSQPSVDKVPAEESTDGGCEENVIDSPPLKKTTMNVDNANEEAVNDSVVVLSDSETNTVEAERDDAVIILSDEEDEGVDRTGYESLKETYEEKKVKPKFTTVNNIVEPKPLEILSRVEKAEAKKESAFSCDELEMYLNVHKQNSDVSHVSANTNDIEHEDRKEKLCKAEVKEYMKKATPDLDEIDGCVFVSFSCEQALKAHMALEKKLDWLTEAQLKKLAQLQHMKERQNDSGSKRITDVKSSDEQKLNFRGIPMRMMKYQKMLKQELEDILLGRQKSTEKSPLKHPAKTTDITKIKGWKSKFQNQEELQEATGINISDSGKVHWKTEERLVKNLDPEEIKDTGLDLKKKRRKLVNYSNRKKNHLGLKLDDNNAEPMDYEYELDEHAITEHDVYNEDDDKPQPEKIPYKCKYLSQHKYGARKLFVKRMKLDAEDERILQKLGTQKMRSDEGNQCLLKPKTQKSQGFTLSKVTHYMAVAAVSAFDKKLLTKAKNMAKAEMSRLKKKGLKDITHTVAEADEVDTKVNDHYDDVEDIPYEEKDEFGGIQIKEEPVDIVPEEIVPKRGRLRTKSRRQSSTSKSPGSVPNNDNNEAIEGEKLIKSEDRKVERASSETCPEPGCRYGCICYLCKLSDSGEERETDQRPQCDKEYCRLGCICDSIDTTTTEKQHCKKPGCMIECKCPPKQPKPDIPRERDHGKRKKKGRISRKKKQILDKSELENSDKEENINEDGEWEPPSKRRKGAGYSKRFTNLPKRETTYRLAKNLDAVSRKAMEVYATSEMYAEQKVRRRRSDQGWVDDWMDKKRQPESRLNEFTGVLEISDDEESYPAELVSCARTLLPYHGPYKQRQTAEEPVIKKDVPHLNKRKGGPSGKRFNSKEVIELDSDTDTNSSRKDSGQSDLPSTSSDVHQKKPPQTLTEKMGLVNLIRIEKEVTPSMEPCRWKTQMVCLKAKKKSDDKSQSSHAEIKLLEIMSNCNWEIDRTNMLSKISHIISKDSGFDYPRSQRVGWGAYVLEFLPKADIPALIPPELKSKLPEHIFSIRIKVTKDQSSTSTGEPLPKDRHLTTEERKRHIMKWQKKLIDKIKFAERLRNLIIAEEQNGVKNSKFSVSREGIEKALKKYKTQLWKAYTGSSNLTLQQLKQALQAAKSNAEAKSAEPESKKAESKKGPTRPNLLSTATKARIQSNQGVTVIGPNTSRNSQSQKFINLGNLNPCSVSMPFSSGTPTSFGNIVIHQAGVNIASTLASTGSAHTFGSAATGVVSTKTSSAHGSIVTATSAQPMKGRATKKPRPMETEPLLADLSKAIYLQPAKPVSGPGSAGSLSSVESSRGQPGGVSGVLEDVVLMPLDKNVNPNNLPPGVKLAVLQQVPSRNETISSGPVSLLPPMVNQSLKMKTCSTTVNGQNFRVGSPIMSPMVISSLASVRPHSPSLMLGNKITATSAPSVSSLVGQGVMPCLTAQSSTSTTVTNIFPLKNISNINPAVPSNVVSNVTSTATSTICSPSIYPIQFANQSVIANSTTSSEIHVVMPPRDMIGLPKVSSVPFKIYPAASSVGGKPLQFLVPVSMPFSNSMGDACVTLQSILPAPPNIAPTFVNTAAKSAACTGETEPVPGPEKQDTTADKKKKKSRKKKPAKVDLKEVGQPNNVDEGMNEGLPNKSENKKHSKALANLDLVSEKVDQLPCQMESKDSSSLPPCDAATESEIVDGSVENENVKSNDKDHDVEQNILNIRIEDVKSIRDESLDGCSAVCDQNPPIKCVKTESSEELGVEMLHHSDLANGKRASPDLLDLIDIEQTMKQMDEMENEAGIRNDHGVNGTVDDAIPIEDSEESDVDIMTCDLLESSGTGKRKARQSASDEDDNQNKKLKTDELKNSKTEGCGAPRRTARTSREKCRRYQLRCLFETLEQVVFKYNTEMQTMQGSIPKHLILQEAYGLAQALKQKNEYLQECLEDGKHCKEVLESQLVQQTNEFVDMGVPEPIIRNFLKSVQGTVFLENKKKGRKVTYEQSLPEDDDSTLDFKPLTKWKFKAYEPYDSEAGTSGNHSSSGEMTTTDAVICSKDLQATVELVKSDMDEILEETATEKTLFPSLRNDTKVTGSDYLSDINTSQETLVKHVSQGSDDPPLSEITYIASDMAVDRSVCGQDDNLVDNVVDSDDDDIQSTTGDAMHDYENESVRSEHSNDIGDNYLSNTDLVPSKIE